MARRRELIRKKIGDILVDAEIITRPQLVEALEVQKLKGGKLGEILVELGFMNKSTLLATLGKQRGITFVSLREIGDIPPEAIESVPKSLVKKRDFIPISKERNIITIAIHDPNDIMIADDLRAMTGCEINIVVASEEEVREARDKYYGEEQQTVDAVVEQLDHDKLSGDYKVALVGDDEDVSTIEGNAAPIVKLVNFIITDAVRKRSSDIHFEPYEKKIRMRYRIDGVLHEVSAPPKMYQNAIISRIKIMSKLDISERRLPQDGNMGLRINDKDIDFRISIIPVKFGEKAVIRILDSSNMCQNLELLGFDPGDLSVYKKGIDSPHGLVLVTGPTGSGKTTTLYSSVSFMNNNEINISTIEDPVEYTLEGINQVQVKPDIGLNFASGLRAFLRQDPDVILVGEIRDLETVEVAVQASLTGHLVFSTLHTNDAPSTIVRLLNMGVEPFLITSSLIMIVAQRIMRIICDQCKESYEIDTEVLRSMGYPGEYLEQNQRIQLWRGRGCSNCTNTGYRGRIAIYEVMQITNKIREQILQRELAHRIRETAIENGMTTLRQAAFRKVLSGVTTLEELARVVFADD